MSDDRPIAISLFAGVGGFDRALGLAGFNVIGQVEIDTFGQRILARRFPGVRQWGDVRDVGRDEPALGHGSAGVSPDHVEPGARRGVSIESGGVDLIVGGFPCQGASVAGKRLGLADDRTALFWEIVRIQKVIRAPWGLFENVPGLRSVTLGRDFEAVLAALKECWPVVGWRTLDSRYFGVPQRRARVFFVCGPDEARVSAVLFEPARGGGHPPKSGEAGARVAAGTPASTISASGGRRKEDDVNLVMGTLREHVREAGSQPTGTLVGTTMAVRRLTPTETERLQAFPDGWTCLCLSLDEWARDPEDAAERCACADGPRYRAMGNAVTVSVIEWITRRLYLRARPREDQP